MSEKEYEGYGYSNEHGQYYDGRDGSRYSYDQGRYVERPSEPDRGYRYDHGGFGLPSRRR